VFAEVCPSGSLQLHIALEYQPHRLISSRASPTATDSIFHVDYNANAQ